MKKLPRLMVFPGEDEIERKLFDKSPVLAISKFLECFSSEGDQCFEVPRHVLEFLAASLSQFMDGGAESLDVAFGGKTTRQRNALEGWDRDGEIVFDLLGEWENFKKIPKAERSSTPFELAIEQIAKKYELGEESVRRIYKKSKRPPPG